MDDELAKLPEDVIEEILLKLPIGNLIKLRLVCKQWFKLITSDTFAYRRVQLRTIYKCRYCSVWYVLCVLFNKSFVIKVAGKLTELGTIKLPQPETFSGRGMHTLFLIGYGIYCVFEVLTGAVLLWNPTIKQTKLLPPSRSYPFSRTRTQQFGIMDYKHGKFTYKVGRVFSRERYVELPRSGLYVFLSLELYSSETKSWKIIHNFSSGEYLGYSDHISHCVNLNGRVHWVIQFGAEDTYVTTFDYETEIFGRIKAPSPSEVGQHYNKGKCLVTLFSEKFLCLGLTREIDNERCYLDIWIMLEYGIEDSWTKKFTIGPLNTHTEVLGFCSKLPGVYLWPKKDYPAQLHLWDCKTSKIRKYWMKGRNPREQYLQIVQVQDMESLVCPY